MSLSLEVYRMCRTRREREWLPGSGIAWTKGDERRWRDMRRVVCSRAFEAVDVDCSPPEWCWYALEHVVNG